MNVFIALKGTQFLNFICIKSFLEVQDKCVNFSAVIQDFSPIVYNSDQMSFTAVPLSECMLSDKSLCSSKCAMILEHTMCSSNLHGTQIRETGR